MQIKDNATLTVSLAAQDAKGNQTKLDPQAAPSWSVDNEALASLVAASDGLSCVVTPAGALGSFNVQCSIGAVGAEPALSGALPVEVIASDATQIVLSGTSS